ncbi:hypothetical protein SODALDRAFT_363598 [Sodiomyces alkalinus F11]|uniref:Uncharacterized protein n=1 Tax=Sodiomyces alkalinus (strain CBS 110278 / VKM F-3762 / F11) TaxID=1314773 RepID=A0A3N2PK52_SODAK|nr:hypothetical protein SODALDRAFT_363598 [Sodiomyces alkalinus F11]ROT34911.1 hypothetical protein SODALDRAFT_363598 [Sodiomyces alkalinus F11]
MATWRRSRVGPVQRPWNALRKTLVVQIWSWLCLSRGGTEGWGWDWSERVGRATKGWAKTTKTHGRELGIDGQDGTNGPWDLPMNPGAWRNLLMEAKNSDTGTRNEDRRNNNNNKEGVGGANESSTADVKGAWIMQHGTVSAKMKSPWIQQLKSKQEWSECRETWSSAAAGSEEDEYIYLGIQYQFSKLTHLAKDEPGVPVEFIPQAFSNNTSSEAEKICDCGKGYWHNQYVYRYFVLSKQKPIEMLLRVYTRTTSHAKPSHADVDANADAVSTAYLNISQPCRNQW